MPISRPRVALDEIDLAIVEALQTDGRASARRIAGRLGLGVTTTRTRINRLLSEELIRVVALPNVLEAEHMVLALVQLRTESPVGVANELARRSDVPWVVLCSGTIDILLSVYSVGLEFLLQSVREMNALADVSKVEVSVSLRVVKHGYVSPTGAAYPISPAPPQPADHGPEEKRLAIDVDPIALHGLIRERLDATDLGIVQMLHTDGRLEFKRIASELGLSEGAVRKRVNRLLGARLIQIVAVTAPAAYENACMGVASIAVNDDPVPCAEQIAAWPEVTWLSLTAGASAIMAEFITPTREAMLELMQRLHAMPGLAEVQVWLYLKTIKQVYLGPLRQSPRALDG